MPTPEQIERAERLVKGTQQGTAWPPTPAVRDPDHEVVRVQSRIELPPEILAEDVDSYLLQSERINREDILEALGRGVNPFLEAALGSKNPFEHSPRARVSFRPTGPDIQVPPKISATALPSPTPFTHFMRDRVPPPPAGLWPQAFYDQRTDRFSVPEMGQGSPMQDAMLTPHYALDQIMPTMRPAAETTLSALGTGITAFEDVYYGGMRGGVEGVADAISAATPDVVGGAARSFLNWGRSDAERRRSRDQRELEDMLYQRLRDAGYSYLEANKIVHKYSMDEEGGWFGGPEGFKWHRPDEWLGPRTMFELPIIAAPAPLRGASAGLQGAGAVNLARAAEMQAQRELARRAGLLQFASKGDLARIPLRQGLGRSQQLAGRAVRPLEVAEEAVAKVVAAPFVGGLAAGAAGGRLAHRGYRHLRPIPPRDPYVTAPIDAGTFPSLARQVEGIVPTSAAEQEVNQELMGQLLRNRQRLELPVEVQARYDTLIRQGVNHDEAIQRASGIAPVDDALILPTGEEVAQYGASAVGRGEAELGLGARKLFDDGIVVNESVALDMLNTYPESVLRDYHTFRNLATPLKKANLETKTFKEFMELHGPSSNLVREGLVVDETVARQAISEGISAEQLRGYIQLHAIKEPLKSESLRSYRFKQFMASGGELPGFVQSAEQVLSRSYTSRGVPPTAALRVAEVVKNFEWKGMPPFQWVAPTTLKAAKEHLKKLTDVMDSWIKQFMYLSPRLKEMTKGYNLKARIANANTYKDDLNRFIGEVEKAGKLTLPEEAGKLGFKFPEGYMGSVLQVVKKLPEGLPSGPNITLHFDGVQLEVIHALESNTFWLDLAIPPTGVPPNLSRQLTDFVENLSVSNPSIGFSFRVAAGEGSEALYQVAGFTTSRSAQKGMIDVSRSSRREILADTPTYHQREIIEEVPELPPDVLPITPVAEVTPTSEFVGESELLLGHATPGRRKFERVSRESSEGGRETELIIPGREAAAVTPSSEITASHLEAAFGKNLMLQTTEELTPHAVSDSLDNFLSSVTSTVRRELTDPITGLIDEARLTTALRVARKKADETGSTYALRYLHELQMFAQQSGYGGSRATGAPLGSEGGRLPPHNSNSMLPSIYSFEDILDVALLNEPLSETYTRLLGGLQRHQKDITRSWLFDAEIAVRAERAAMGAVGGPKFGWFSKNFVPTGQNHLTLREFDELMMVMHGEWDVSRLRPQLRPFLNHLRPALDSLDRELTNFFGFVSAGQTPREAALTQHMATAFLEKVAPSGMYMPRGWSHLKPEGGMRRYMQKIGQFGKKPMFMGDRMDYLYSEMRGIDPATLEPVAGKAGREYYPSTLDPLEMFATSWQAKVEYVQQTLFLNNLSKNNIVRAVHPGGLRGGRDRYPNALDEADLEAMGDKVPEGVGPVFSGHRFKTVEGEVGRSLQMAIPLPLARHLEMMYDNLGTGGWGAVQTGIGALKRHTLMASGFQHVDIGSRGFYSNFTPSSAGNRFSGPRIMMSSFVHGAANVFSPRARQETAKLIRSDALVYSRREQYQFGIADDPILSKITWSDISLGGRGGGDFSVMMGTVGSAFDDLIATAPQHLHSKALERVGMLKKQWEMGLFEGWYPAMYNHVMRSHYLPNVRKMHPHYNAKQVAGQAAKDANVWMSTFPVEQSVIRSQGLRSVLQALLFSTVENEALLRVGFRMFQFQSHGPKASSTIKSQYPRTVEAAAEKELAQMWIAGREYFPKHIIGGDVRILTNTSAAQARELWFGAYVGLAVLANTIHYASTGEPLPLESYIPIEINDPHAPFRISYSTRFMAPATPFRDANGERIYLDLVGQLDTPLRWAVNPTSAFSARLNIPMRVLKTQYDAKNFLGQEISGFRGRVLAAAEELAVPISAKPAMDVVSEKVDALGRIRPQQEPRLSTSAKISQGLSGLNLRGETVEGVKNAAVRAIYPNKPMEELELWELDIAFSNPATKAGLNSRASEGLATDRKHSRVWYDLQQIDKDILDLQRDLVKKEHEDGWVDTYRMRNAALQGQRRAAFNSLLDIEELEELADPSYVDVRIALEEGGPVGVRKAYGLLIRMHTSALGTDWDSVEAEIDALGLSGDQKAMIERNRYKGPYDPEFLKVLQRKWNKQYQRINDAFYERWMYLKSEGREDLVPALRRSFYAQPPVAVPAGR